MLKIEKGDLLVFGLFLLLSLGFFGPFLAGVNILGYRDLSLYFYPLRHLMVELVRSGQLPLWNPDLFLGYPLLATLQVRLVSRVRWRQRGRRDAAGDENHRRVAPPALSLEPDWSEGAR